MKPALGLVESAWFFRRGKQYVRIVRVDCRTSGLSLVVDGPDGSHVAHFDDPMACAIHQCELERQLVTKDYHLERVSATKPSSAAPVLTIPTRQPFPTGPFAA
jgi:hypothetical protein